MPDSKRYTTISLHEDLKAGFESLKGGDETNNEVMRRALAALREKEDHRQARAEEQNRQIERQDRLLVRMAWEMGLDKDQIPSQMIAEESRGDTIDQADDPLTGIVTPREESNEATLDLNQQQRKTADELRSKAHDRVIEQRKANGNYERPGDNPPREMVGDDQMQRAMVEVIEENPDEWAAAAEQLAADGEPEEGWMDSFDNGDNGGDH